MHYDGPLDDAYLELMLDTRSRPAVPVAVLSMAMTTKAASLAFGLELGLINRWNDDQLFLDQTWCEELDMVYERAVTGMMILCLECRQCYWLWR
jgi:hypothetical protein